MARHHGKPSGADKSEGTGIPTNISPEKMNEDIEITKKYTEEEGVAKNVHVQHPNRNTNKNDATSAGGYKQ